LEPSIGWRGACQIAGAKEKEAVRTAVPVAVITNGLYVIPVGPVNTFLLDAKDGCALIDTGVPDSAKKIRRNARDDGTDLGTRSVQGAAL
jgi:glyoxylase-like metal-dependent hydrolase (beta-lactamase superfamily II)